MNKSKNNKGRQARRPAKSGRTGELDLSQIFLSRLEFHRHALALLPEAGDRGPGVVFFVEGDKHEPQQRFCTCDASAKKTCPHIAKLAQVYRALGQNLREETLLPGFHSSIWFRLGGILADDCRETPQTVRMRVAAKTTRPEGGAAEVSGDGRKAVTVQSSQGEEMLVYTFRGPDGSRFMERCGKFSGHGQLPHRAAILDRLALLTLTENERFMMDRGFKTQKQVLEESFWYRLAYHGYREFGPTGCTFHPAIEEAAGNFTVMCCTPSGEPVLRVFVPRQKVKRLIAAFKDLLPNQHQMPIHPIPLKSIFKVNMNTELDLEVRPLIQLIQENGEAKFFERDDLERFRYGDLIYIPELGILAELEKPGQVQKKFKAPVKMVLKKSQVPSFLEEFGDELREGAHLIDARIEGLQIFRHVDRLEITPETLERDWCWLSVTYGFGNSAVSLADVLRAKEENQRFIGTPEGWVDCQSSAMEGLDHLMREADFEMPGSDSDLLKLSRMDLLRIQASGGRAIQVKGISKESRLLKRILDLKPVRKLPPLKGMTSVLRRYQEHGLAWIWFLCENGLGGLLCDDMGLGKTHQVMAFMLGLHEQKKTTKPFLVVCPTTVLSHWTRKIKEHVPALKATAYHGGQRDLAAAIKENQVLLTSYGILRRDIDALKQTAFQLAVFDEIQHIKNPETLAHNAAREINAAMKLGLTGTPIENTPDELKALFDLTVPGYLGSDDDFVSRYVNPIAENLESDAPKRLARLISPFTLRRLKKTVLKELPEKIEDIRTCRLSEDQVKLYRDAISSRGRHLLKELRSDDNPVPYMHIFALLNLLKQICNHPALVKGEVEDYDRYRSGKWDLFAELMVESLDSGQKVVVYSQFLGMIEIIKRLLSEMGVGFVTLTGASTNRGDLIDRFNEDPDCRVYVGSLKAGGAGVDLVGGSVVIHYDRWWNAAKEDQATDRVHRIGQRRGVHVFKLVTEGTLEEKISAIIEKKRNLMDKIIKEDDPGLMKRFSRQEIIEMLAEPY